MCYIHLISLPVFIEQVQYFQHYVLHIEQMSLYTYIQLLL